MTRRNDLEADLGSWLGREADAPVPAAARDRALQALSTVRPRPERLARIGSHWAGDLDPTRPRLPTWPIAMPGARAASVVLLILLTLALAGAAVLVGRELNQRSPELGRLVYGIDGDIFLADWDGRSAIRVADGDPFEDDPIAPVTSYGSPTWAPDGRHFLYQGKGTTHIAGPDGRVVASIPGLSGAVTWSPDSTRLHGWTDDWSQIAVYGTDGGRQALLALPAGYERFREHAGQWAPDSRSLFVSVGLLEVQTSPRETWLIPVDGSLSTRLGEDDPRSSLDHAFAPDASRIAFADFSLFVADADGTHRRVLDEDPAPEVGEMRRSAVQPMWSPDGTSVAYGWVRNVGNGSEAELRVVDIASGAVRVVASDVRLYLSLVGWSPAGDKLLFRASNDQGGGSLWAVNPDGTGRSLLVEGATEGGWQWDFGGNPPIPSPSPTAARPPAPAATSAMGIPFLLDEVPAALLGAGLYEASTPNGAPVNVLVDLPAGWNWSGSHLWRDGGGGERAAISFFDGRDVEVYVDPCRWDGSATANSGSVDDLVTALAAQRMRGATTPIDRNAASPVWGTSGSRPGISSERWSGMSVELTVPGDIDIAQECSSGEFRSWGSAVESSVRRHASPGEHHLIWAVDTQGNGVDVDGEIIIIDATWPPGTTADVLAQMDAILASIAVGHWG